MSKEFSRTHSNGVASGREDSRWKDERIAELTAAVGLILPLARGYVAAHPIESSKRYIAFAERALDVQEKDDVCIQS